MWQYTSNGDGYLYGNGGVGNVYIDLNNVKNINKLLKPGITPEDEPVVIPVPLTQSQKVDKLWDNHPNLH
jgi:hypothetical protein